MILGDDFAFHTLQQHFKGLKSEDGTPTTYTYLNFEVRAYLTSESSNNSKNILCRIRNGLVTALNEHAVLPKVIVVVLDDVKDDPNVDLEFHYERLLSGLCNLISKTIDCYKDLLPLKAKRENIPHVLWIAPPNHHFFSENNNIRRELFGKALNIAITAQKSMSVLRLVKFWDKDNSNLFLDIKRIIFQCYMLQWSSRFLMAQLKQSWQHWQPCIEWHFKKILFHN